MPCRLVGNNHVNLTVTDLERSTKWYCELFGLTVVSTHENVGPPYFTDARYNGLFDLTTASYVIGLVEHPDGRPDGFDHRRVGLDHFGLQVPEAADLPDWVERLDSLEIEHSGIVETPYAFAVSFRDPDGIALELSSVRLEFWGDLVAKVAG